MLTPLNEGPAAPARMVDIRMVEELARESHFQMTDEKFREHRHMDSNWLT
jgi:hypothetical protein